MRRLAGRLITGVALTAALFYPSTAQADHGFDTLEVPECQAYTHVLENNDQLYLCRITGLELSHADPDDALGATGIVLRLDSAGSPVRTVSVPDDGYSLAAIYFGSEDGDIPTYATTTTEIILLENPALFPTPATSTPRTPEFNADSTLATTSALIAEDLPRVMLRLETSDPEVPTETYLSGTSITQTGKDIIAAAFPQLPILAASAFVLSIESAGGDFTNPTSPPFVEQLKTTGRNSPFSLGIESLGETFGFPFFATTLIFMLILFIGIVVILWKLTNGAQTAYIWIFPILYIGARIGGFSFEAMILIPVAILGLAGIVLINRHVSN
jgi:hypothetical protein